MKRVRTEKARDSLFVGKHSHAGCGRISSEVSGMDPVKIGKRIAELRRKEGLTQEALGEKLGVSNKTISRWENGNDMPDIEMLPLLAREFKISIDELLGGEGKQRNASARTGTQRKAQSFRHRKTRFRWKSEKRIFRKSGAKNISRYSRCSFSFSLRLSHFRCWGISLTFWAQRRWSR